MNEYFIRHSMNPETDCKRGFSAVGSYILSSVSEAAALRDLATMRGIDTDDAAEFESFCEETTVLWHDELDGWVDPRAGLCAHAAFDTLEEALQAIADNEVVFLADSGMRDMGDLYVFEGVRVFEQTMDDGICFEATGKFWRV